MLLVIVGTSLFMGLGCPTTPPVEPSLSLSPSLIEPGQCDPEPGGSAPRPLWREQPDRVMPFATTGHDASSLGQIVSCDPNKLGQYPVPEGGNPHPKGADLQNLSTNFHVLQSLTMTASIGSKALGKIQKFQTDINAPQGMEGQCLCHTVTCLEQNSTREACDLFCAANGCGGTLVWLPNDAYKTPTGAVKFAARHLNLLDDLQDFANSPVNQAITNALGNTVGTLENLNDITARMQCWIDLGLEGYHLGGYDEQRPDLHLCVGYYGHGAFAGLGESGKFSIGGRYSSHNLSQSHRAQMRAGGWGVTAFGRTLTLLPNVEFNTQLDGYRFFDKCKPLGFSIGGDPVFNCPNGFGIWVDEGSAPAGTLDIDKIDMFHLVDRERMQSLDSDGNGVLSGGEFIVAGYHPFFYPDNAAGPYKWPRDTIQASWEGQVASVVSAGINIDPHITPIEKRLGSYVLFPGVTFVPILTLRAGLEWDHEAYKLRSRILDALNKNIDPSLQFHLVDFERDMHAMQAPDLTADTGVSAYVTPGVKAQLVVGLTLSRFLEVGISAFVGLELDIRPGAHGGVVDLNLALVNALNASNPPDGPCKPVLDTTSRTVCSDKSYDQAEPNHSNPLSTYACTPSESANSCCIKFNVKGQQNALCIDDWTGIPKAACNCKDGLPACYEQFKKYVPSGASAKIEGWLQSGVLSSISTTWNENKTCVQCEKDKTCQTEWWGRTPSLTSLSACAQHGYCVIPGTSAPVYDVTAEDCDKRRGTFYRYQCIDETQTVITRWEGPGCHPLNNGFPSACGGCGEDADCARGETCDLTTARCSATPANCACNPPGNAEPEISCGNGRVCIEGACVRPCGGNDCPEGFVCGSAGACVSRSGIPYAEQIAWLADHPAQGARHSIETYGLTDITLKMILSSGIKIGATVRLLGRRFEFLIWKWADAWDLGSTQKAKYQPGLEASYLDECHGGVGTVTNHQPGTGDPLTCSIGDSYVCRYPSAQASNWSSYDQPNELLALCKNEMPRDVEDPRAPTADDFGQAVTDTLDFGVDVGTNVWNNSAQMCVGDQLLLDWAKKPPQLQGQCTYFGDTAGAPTTFPCLDLELYSMQIWGCVNTTTGWGAQVKNFLVSHGLDPHTPDYLVNATYASSLTSAQVIDLHALVVDPSVPAASAQFDAAVWAAANASERLMLRNFLSSVDQCYNAHYQSESVCQCGTTADCDAGAGERCENNQCLQSSGTLATCPFIRFDATIEPHPCCGDKVLEKAANEQCDDGNLVGGDGCSADCKLEKGPAACCTPGGCIDMKEGNAKECSARSGNLFYGKTCAELDQCGHSTQGGCLDGAGSCHQPMTAAQCERDFKGRFLEAGCKR
ncbi:hypothetical protein [Archangium violaceum]|uniref:hypothetical protein n=1 Tax=Archangium violaceum TaxID=83451 RepID=UPI001EF4FDF2|nr:hypothetical protein [Archangium violaceum]